MQAIGDKLVQAYLALAHAVIFTHLASLTLSDKLALEGWCKRLEEVIKPANNVVSLSIGKAFLKPVTHVGCQNWSEVF